MSDAGADGMSKSAKKRAAKKARDDAHEEPEVPAAPVPPPPAAKAKGKAKAEPAPAPAPPAAEPKAKAKGKAKAAPAPEPPAPPAPEPKAKAKGKAKAAPAPEPAPAPPAPEPKAKAKGKAKAEPKAEPKPEPPAPASKAQGKAKAGKKAKDDEEEVEVAKPPKEELINYFLDDGTGGWEESSGLSKKAEKRRQKVEEQATAPRGYNGKHVVQQHVVGLGPVQASGGKGPSQSVAADVKRILAMKGEGGAAVEEKAAEPVGNLSTVSVVVPEKRIGVVIGPKGANIKLLQEKCGVMRIDTSGTIFTITGEPGAVAKCESAIKDLVEKGYCPIMFEGFSENLVTVHPSSFPDLIGKEGCVVRKIKDALKVEVNFQDIGKGAAPGKKAKVTLAGSAENVEKAKSVINNIVMYGHDELTHPGIVHEEIDIEEWQYRFIIGSKGSEMKHIQHNWKVKVNIPREHSENKTVLIIGELAGVTGAKAYIEKVVWNAQDAAKGRDRQDKVEDPWGVEEEEEPWMKQYMYKR